MGRKECECLDVRRRQTVKTKLDGREADILANVWVSDKYLWVLILLLGVCLRTNDVDVLMSA